MQEYNGFFEQLTGENEGKRSYQIILHPRFTEEQVLLFKYKILELTESFKYYPPGKYNNHWLVYFNTLWYIKNKTALEDTIYYIATKIFQ